MDFFIYTTVTVVWWALSVSILLPLVIFLMICKTFRDKWFSWFFLKASLALQGPALDRARKRTFDLLQDHSVVRENKKPVEILEIGIGGGATLPLYPENSNLTGLEPNKSMIGYLEENLKKHTHVNYRKTVVARAEDMREIEDDSFDLVVGTYVLCSVQCVRSSLQYVELLKYIKN